MKHLGSVQASCLLYLNGVLKRSILLSLCSCATSSAAGMRSWPRKPCLPGAICGIDHARGVRALQVREQLGALQAACAALRGSADLMTVLRAVLLTGNHLNEGTHRGAADGALPLLAPPSCSHSTRLTPV